MTVASQADTVRALFGTYDATLNEITDAQDEKALIGPVKAYIEMYTNMIEADRRGWSFDTWQEAIKSYFYDENNLALDSENKLRGLADLIFTQDLKPFFETYVGSEPRDVEKLCLQRRIFDDWLDTLLSK